MSRTVVAKFGGTSLAEAAQIRKVQAIIDADPARRFVVPSAPGKRHSKDAKVTDLLLVSHRLVSTGQDLTPVWTQVLDRFREIVSGLGLALDLEPEFAEARHRIEFGAGAEYAASRGEAWNGRIIAALLDAEFVDAADVVRFRPGGRLDPETYRLIVERCNDSARRYVIPGFYGADAHGEVRTFSRGGSDISGSIVAAAVAAEVYENWTDVSGVLMADPRIIADAKPIREITYKELRELSYMGASVLHEEAVFPVRERGIPINIRNTNRPDDLGTIISAHRDPGDQVVVGIAGTAGFSVFHLEKALMNNEIGFDRRVCDVFERLGVSIEHTPSSIDTMSVVVSDTQVKERHEHIVEELRAAVQPDVVEVHRGMALIATVGLGMDRRVGVSAKLFTALAETGVNIRMIDQGSSEQNIIVGVEEGDLARAITAIYRAFVPA